MTIRILLLLIPFTVFADTVTFEAPTEREDNTPLAPSEIQEFRVYDSQGNMVKSLGGTVRNFDIPATSVEQNLFMTTLDTDGRESVYSEGFTIPKLTAKPKPPRVLSVSRR